MTAPHGGLYTVSDMRARAVWDDPRQLKQFLAGQLLDGRLALVLGAGASRGFGLPDWDTLVDQLFAAAGQPRPGNVGNEIAAEGLLRDVFDGDRVRFAQAVHDTMYAGFDVSANAIRKNDLLAAVGALVMASRRGHVRRVISFNFDNVLELYLRYFGFSVDSPTVLPAWESTADIRVYHAHGWLPYHERVTRGVVFTQEDFDVIVGNQRDAWRRVMVDTFTSHTCLFLGVSGRDQNLLQVMTETRDRHVGRSDGDAFWGVRFGADPADPYLGVWEQRGVYPQRLATYDELPGWLFELCQLAAERARRA